MNSLTLNDYKYLSYYENVAYDEKYDLILIFNILIFLKIIYNILEYRW